jgi:hypothetical protein
VQRSRTRSILQSAKSRNWDVQATKVIAEARKLPLGQRRSDALKEAGRLPIAGDEPVAADKVKATYDGLTSASKNGPGAC